MSIMLDVSSVTCPLSHELFLHPVLLPDGRTYDRSEVEGLVRNRKSGINKIHVRCPLDGDRPIGDARRLLPNNDMLSLVNSFVDQNPDHALTLEWRKRKGDELYSRGRIREAAMYGHEESLKVKQLEDLTATAAELVAQAKRALEADPESKDYRVKLREASACGSNDARLMMGVAYAKGIAGKQSDAKATEWFMKTNEAARFA